MQCGNKQNHPAEIIRLFLLFFICCSGAFSVACQSQPKDAAAALQPCQALIDKEDILAAGECYNSVLAANPQFGKEIEETFSKSFFAKCLELKDKENYKQAIVCLEGLSILAPDVANVQFHLAGSYYRYSRSFRYQDRDLLERAETAIKKSLEINPDKAITHEIYGEILESKGDLRGAIKVHQQALKIDPKEYRLWMNLALVQEKIGDLSSAIASYYQALLLDPKNSLALYNSALLYEKTGNADKAIENFEKLLVIETHFDDAEARLENLKKQKTAPPPKNGTRIGTSDGKTGSP